MDGSGKTLEGVTVPYHLVYKLGAGKKPRVRVKINGYSFKGRIEKRENDFYLPFPLKERKNVNSHSSDHLNIEIELDYETHAIVIPEELVAFFYENDKAKNRFEQFSITKQRGLLLRVQIAKNETIRQRQIKKFINNLLKEKKGL